MKSRKNIIEKTIKKHKELWIAELARRAKVSYPTAHKWVFILQLEGKVEVKNIAGLRIVRWLNG